LSARASGAAGFAGLAGCFGGAIGIADGAGGSDGLGDLLVRGALALTLFDGRHFRQGIKVFFAVDQDWNQHLAVLGEQDALSPLLGAQPDPEYEADCPIARDDATIFIDHEDWVIRCRLIGEAFRDCVFRRKSATDSGMKSATDSDLISAIPI
jgi:hypothetical protein